MTKIKHSSIAKCLRDAQETLADLVHTLNVAAQNESNKRRASQLILSQSRTIVAIEELDMALLHIKTCNRKSLE